MTFYFRVDRFSDKIMVALTAMLVLATLLVSFQSVRTTSNFTINIVIPSIFYRICPSQVSSS